MKAIGLVVILSSSVVAAQDAPATDTPAPAEAPAAPLTSTPHFLLADSHDATSSVGIGADYMVLAGDADGHAWRLDARLQTVNAVSHLGFYLHVPISMLTGTEYEDTTALGNIEAGGIFVADLGSPTVGLVLHAGITAPTAPTVTMEAEPAFLGVLTGLMRPSDLYVTLPRSSTARFGISSLVRSGDVFARFDLGFDANLYFASSDDTLDPAIHIDGGLGFDLGTMNAALMIELSALHIFGDASEQDTNISSAAVSVRGHSGKAEPYVGVSIPLDKEVRDIFDAGVIFGIDRRFEHM
jgi:hypothetical protein